MCLVFITITWSPQSPVKTSKRFDFRLLIRLKKKVKQGGKHTCYNNNSKIGDVVLDIVFQRGNQNFLLYCHHVAASCNSNLKFRTAYGPIP